MHKFSLSENGQNLKRKLKIKNFYGQTSWTESTNIAKAHKIPTIMINNHSNRVLQIMKWGLHLFHNETNKQPKNLQHQVRSDTLTQTNSFKNAWTSSLNQNQRCIIVAKGFYITTKQMNKQYYVTPHSSENEFFYIAALYSRNKKKFNVVAITKSTKNDELEQYMEQMPYLLTAKNIDTWLNKQTDIAAILNKQHQIKYDKITEIGSWLEDNSIKDENIISRAKEEWDIDQYDTDINMKELDWEKIEKDALQQIAARKITNSNQFPNDNTNNTQDTPTNAKAINDDDNMQSHKPQPTNKKTIKKENPKVSENKLTNQVTNDNNQIQKQTKNNNRKRKRNEKQQVNREISSEPARKKYKRNKKKRG